MAFVVDPAFSGSNHRGEGREEGDGSSLMWFSFIHRSTPTVASWPAIFAYRRRDAYSTGAFRLISLCTRSPVQ